MMHVINKNSNIVRGWQQILKYRAIIDQKLSMIRKITVDHRHHYQHHSVTFFYFFFVLLLLLYNITIIRNYIFYLDFDKIFG